MAVPESTLTIERIVTGDGTTTLVCRGRITMETGGQFRSEVKSLKDAQKYVLADLSAVNYVDSGGLGEVLAAYISARSAGCELKLVNVHPRVRDLLDISRLTSVLG
jgi:anti-sigma B factor antagonist